MRRALTGVMIVLVSAITISVYADGILESMNREVAALYQQSKDAVVKVHAQHTPPAGSLPLAPSHRVGTGFFVDAQGRLLTSATVISEATACWIDWQGERVPAKVLGQDPIANVALLEVDPKKCVGEDKSLPFLAPGNARELAIGSMVIAIGYAYDLPSAPTVGFVTGFDIKCGARTFVTSHIRAGCRLRPGQGGGPVLNTRGEVIGLAVAAHLDDQCYILPFEAARKVTDDILAHGATRYGWVGLNVTERRQPGITESNVQWQVFVQQIYSNTPAATAGFREQDVVLAIGTNNIHRASEVLDTMFYRRCGDRLVISVQRDGQRREIELVVGERPPEETGLPMLPPLPPGRPGLKLIPAAGSR